VRFDGVNPLHAGGRLLRLKYPQIAEFSREKADVLRNANDRDCAYLK